MLPLPSYLKPGQPPAGGSRAALTDYALRVGEVVLAYAPTAPENVSKKQWEYVVNVAYRDANGAPYVMPYRCRVADLFGGMGDHLRYAVRATPTPSQVGEFGQGAMVLVLCPNADRSGALIVGGTRHRDDTSVDPSTIFWDFAFNGVHIGIDDQGALVLKVSGPTNADGTPVGEDAGISLRVDPAKKLVEVLSTDVKVQVQGKVEVVAKEVTVTADQATVKAKKVNLGDEEMSIAPQDFVVVGSGIDPFTGSPYFALGNTSKTVKAKK